MESTGTLKPKCVSLCIHSEKNLDEEVLSTISKKDITRDIAGGGKNNFALTSFCVALSNCHPKFRGYLIILFAKLSAQLRSLAPHGLKF